MGACGASWRGCQTAFPVCRRSPFKAIPGPGAGRRRGRAGGAAPRFGGGCCGRWPAPRRRAEPGRSRQPRGMRVSGRGTRRKAESGGERGEGARPSPPERRRMRRAPGSRAQLQRGASRPAAAPARAGNGGGGDRGHRNGILCGENIHPPRRPGGTPMIPGDRRLCSASLGKWDSILSQRGSDEGRVPPRSEGLPRRQELRGAGRDRVAVLWAPSMPQCPEGLEAQLGATADAQCQPQNRPDRSSALRLDASSNLRQLARETGRVWCEVTGSHLGPEPGQLWADAVGHLAPSSARGGNGSQSLLGLKLEEMTRVPGTSQLGP